MEELRAVYFIGAGGIGMSALERYFLACGLTVAGYDKTPCSLTEALSAEGVKIHYTEDIQQIPDVCRDKEHTLVIYTPAIPASHVELQWFREQGFEVKKRAEVLGLLTRQMKGLCVAGTHGKTTTTAITAHLLYQSRIGCNAFLGGIAKNYATNYLVNTDSPYVVIEADEFDRSFHHLRPFATVITATDPDHLDIYGTEEAYRESFSHYTSLIQPDGALLVHTEACLEDRAPAKVRHYTYGRSKGDFHADNLYIGNGTITFDLVSPFERIDNLELGVPVSINIDNSIAAMALAQIAGCTANEIRYAIKSFSGVDRRFDFKLKTDRIVLLSDYAHHPEEIRQSILSVREVFNGRRVTGIFQPHLYSRTRDFYREFADSLSLLDEVILVDIYPAREEPISGITSQLIYDHLHKGVRKRLTNQATLPTIVSMEEMDVLMVLGAGDIDNCVPELEAILKNKA